LKKLGHDLPTIWAKFKEHAKNDPALNNFDAIIAALAAFEELRYPDKMLQEGMQSVVALGGATTITNRKEPLYCLTLKTIDDLIRQVFTLTSINPTFFSSGMNKIAREYLFKRTT
jgi:hypothetical protein